MADFSLHDAFRAEDPAKVQLAAGEVHVWAVPLGGDPAPFAALLSPAERDRCGRYRFADHQRRYQISHGALRSILAGYLDTEPEQVEFRVSKRGKPFLSGDGPYFNLSHSGQLTVIAVSEAELGVDLEKVRHLASFRQIAERHFSGREFGLLSALDLEAQQLAFYRCWTRKEAYIKALGEGLTMSLDSFEVSICEQPSVLACHDVSEKPEHWSLLDVSPAADYVGAIAMRRVSGAPKVRSFCLDTPRSA